MNCTPIDANTRLIGFVAWPAALRSSLPLLNAAFDASGLNWRCVPLPVAKGQLREAFTGLRALGFAGAEIAEPYQCHVVPHLDELSPAAEITGVVNIVRVDEFGRLVGENTRWLGFLAALRTLVPSLNGLRPLVIGAGTAARSIAYTLTHEGLPLTIVDEHMEQAVDLVQRLRHVLQEHSFSVRRWPQDLARAADGANLIVNTTDLAPDVDRSPWPDEVPFPPEMLAFDLAIRPTRTCFLRQAQASGARTVDGLSLLVSEAATAYERWTGQPPPIEAMWRATGETLIPAVSQDAPWPREVAVAGRISRLVQVVR